MQHVLLMIVSACIWIKSAGVVSISFGRGDFGRLGHGNSSDLFTPQPIKALHGICIKQIACGDSHCLAVTMEGEVQRLVAVALERLFWWICKPYAHFSSFSFDKYVCFVSLTSVAMTFVQSKLGASVILPCSSTSINI